VIGIDCHYTTALIAIPSTAPSDWKGVFTFPEAPASTCGALMLLRFAKQLRTSTVYDAIKHSTPPERLPQFGFHESVWRHFERLPYLPIGLLPVGDAICRFNPVYGQGMSVAVQEASVLHRLLGERRALGDPLVGLRAASFKRPFL
jgi:2-polyprenyl-6-methoxyphenol hydroxylase-like FAD-dependent oxidoreductase